MSIAATPLQPKVTSSFFLPMRFMPPKRRAALHTLYRFCRIVDDSIDEVSSKEEARANLLFWRNEITKLEQGVAIHPDTLALQRVFHEFALPIQPLHDMMNGFQIDCASRVQIQSWKELEQYCYSVAGCVGILAAHIMGATSKPCEVFAVTLGHALQLTNILRDLSADRGQQRNYIPLEWFEAYHIDPATTEKAELAVIAHVLHEKALRCFEETRLALPAEYARKLIPALLMRDSYVRLLHAVVKTGSYATLTKRKLSIWDKMQIALRAIYYFTTLPRSAGSAQ
jgi:phytoene synthase